jgi:hypothetical protein
MTHNIMGSIVHLWTLKKREWNRIQAADMKYLRTVKVALR